MVFRFAILLYCLMSLQMAFATNPEVKALNNYIAFLNETDHGLVIIHRLLESSNQELNKYVDLEGYQINNFSNKDLPKNIFEDPEKWFYQISPMQWSDIAKSESKVLPQDQRNTLNKNLDKILILIDKLNALRFDLENFIVQNDLSKIENTKAVYELLETGVDLFDALHVEQVELEQHIYNYAKSYNKEQANDKQLINLCTKNWNIVKQILRAVRNKEDEKLPEYLTLLRKSRKEIEGFQYNAVVGFSSKSNIEAWKMINAKLHAFEQVTEKLVNTADVPKEYKMYGKYYYYHNAVLTNLLNRYGSGFSTEMNTIMSDLEIDHVFVTEEPHFYQIIYPEKLVESKAIISTDENIKIIPTALKDRKIKVGRVIKVDKQLVDINLYDFKLQDGDIVSINFNGDWILENYSLEGSPTKLQLKMNETGKNYMILHAISVGRRPPNTMGMSYMYKGEEQEITLSSDLDESELIELLYKP